MNEQRKCEVKTVIPKSKRIDDSQCIEIKTAIFHGFFKRAYPIEPSPMIGGHHGGTIEYPVAVVEFEDGQVAEVEASMIRFLE